ncbi:hypothetical protein [Marinobacterium rhizophilum]|uniref:Lipoprotein n=1 Tax=Marinobacterium rhizophilum TaxID=420402 RepID=A0ABY5HNL3_9GAMM|nr:hypothetical protein [Marinobacterium rhizophilum]UTW12486.1 hypothetical protein KDW95_02030 [Marinobacterium rhizophilum]
MPRNLLIMPLLLGLLGCQVPGALQTPSHGPACYVSNAALADLLVRQQHYLGSRESARRQQLAQVVKSNDKALEALLLTSPLASAEQFSRGSSLLASLPLYPDAECTADRYLYLHQRQLEPRQQQRSLIQQQNTQIDELKRKIEALTDLEQEITRQRKDL